MKAWFIRSYGGPEVLDAGELPEPTVGPRDVLIEIRAASVNPIDWKIRQGALRPLIKYAFPLILGNDLSGEVIAVGSEVTRFQVGDQVFARTDKQRIGTFAERIAMSEDEVAKKPERLGHAEATALPLVGLTAWQAFVDVGHLEPGHKVLIHAGAGGVGTVAIQLAKHLGAHVAATASEPKHALLRELGADTCIDYRHEDFAARGKEYDLVLDSVGGDTLKKSFAVVRPGGLVVSIAGVPDPALAAEWQLGVLMRGVVWAMSWPTRRLAQTHGARYRYLLMKASGEELAILAKLVDEGKLRPIIDRTFAFAEVDKAIAYAEGSHATGKVVITRA